MAEIRDADNPIGWVVVGPTLIGMAATAGIAYLCDRAYRRWLRESHPLAEHRARVERFKSGYQRKRATVTEVAQLLAEVLVVVASAAPTRDAR